MLQAERPPRPGPVPQKRGCPNRPHAAALARPPPPAPPPTAGGRQEGPSCARVRGLAEASRGRRKGGGDGAEREKAVEAPGGNAAAFLGGLEEGVAGLVGGPVTPEKEGGSGGGEPERKRRLWLAANPPPKRRAVSATRLFPPGCGRGAAPVITGGGSSAEGVVLVGTAISTDVLEKPVALPRAGSGGSKEARSPEQDAPANAGLMVAAADGGTPMAVAADGGAPMAAADGCHHGPHAKVVKTSDGPEGVSGLVPAVEERGRAVGSGESGQGMKELIPIVRVPPKRRMVSAVRTFPPGCGRAVNRGTSEADGKAVHRTEKNAAQDAKAMNRRQGSSSEVAAQAPSQDLPKQLIHDKRVSESSKAAGELGKGNNMRSKVTITARKTVHPPLEADHERALVSPNRPHPMGKGKECAASLGQSLPPKKNLNAKGPAPSKHLPVNGTSTSALVNKGKQKEKEASHEEILKVLTVHKEKLLTVHKEKLKSLLNDGRNADARSKVRMLSRTFQFIFRTLAQAVEQRSLKLQRIYLAADKVVRNLPGYTKPKPIVGKVDGVEVGDEFHYRVELAIVGLHRPLQAGIDTMKHTDGTRIAISVVASGGYPDELSNSDEIIYTGSGGKAAGKKEDEDQKLVGGNLGLKNCIGRKIPVRVIHGFKGQSREDGSQSKAKEVSILTYDGLYDVVKYWEDYTSGLRVYKYKLQRRPNQPELPLRKAKMFRSSERPDLCMADISQGKEPNPISVINNTKDRVLPAPFKYITRIKYPSLHKESPQGCDCTNDCSNSDCCACSAKNDGAIPFNFNGALVFTKLLVFECGPSCTCPPSCCNRVSQHGLKIPLQVFRTAKTGWGVRSLRSISSGSFVCEYVGELLHDKEANERSNDEYLFAIDHNFSDPSDERFTIDAAIHGNIARFINHSCSPNLIAQNVLWDHDDKRRPHIMFFALENIPPLRELTFDYKYNIGNVHDVNGRKKAKDCHCGSLQCRGRLY